MGKRPDWISAYIAVSSALALPAADKLRLPPWRGQINELSGHCYVASEVLYHALGGKRAGWRPMFVRHNGGPHWFLWNALTEQILDVTAGQFTHPPDYNKARGKGFLTKRPSKRAVQLASIAGISL